LARVWRFSTPKSIRATSAIAVVKPTFRRSDGNDWDFSKVPVIAKLFYLTFRDLLLLLAEIIANIIKLILEIFKNRFIAFIYQFIYPKIPKTISAKMFFSWLIIPVYSKISPPFY